MWDATPPKVPDEEGCYIMPNLLEKTVLNLGISKSIIEEMKVSKETQT